MSLLSLPATTSRIEIMALGHLFFACPSMSSSLFNWTGKAYPCCPDIAETLLLGDIHKTNLKRIFNGHMANELRKSLKNKSAFNKFSSCTNCTSFESYKGFKPVWKS